MLTARRAPRHRVAVPAALGSLESAAALALAHVVAGGEAPPVWWLAAFGVMVYGASVPVLRRRASILVVLPVLVAAQVVGHAWLVALAPSAHAGHGHAATIGQGDAMLGLTGPMLVAHAVAAAATGVMWTLRRRAVELLLTWLDARAVRTLTRPRRAVHAAAVRRTTAAVLSLAPTRGPPAVVPATS